MRDEQLQEEATLDPDHVSLYVHASNNIDEKDLLQFLGFVNNIPVCYAAFQPCVCGCGRVNWRFLYVPVQLRKYGIGLKFVRAILLNFAKFKPDLKIEVTFVKNNRPTANLFRYFGMKEIHRTGVSTVGELLTRQGHSRNSLPRR